MKVRRREEGRGRREKRMEEMRKSVCIMVGIVSSALKYLICGDTTYCISFRTPA